MNKAYILDDGGYILSIYNIGVGGLDMSLMNHTLDEKPDDCNRFINGHWINEPDNRGIWHSPSTNDEIRILDRGALPPSNYIIGISPSSKLIKSKDRKWNEIKETRSTYLISPLETVHGTFDCDKESQSNIMKAALDAKTRHDLGLPSDLNFTLLNNTRPTFTMAQIIGIAMTMGEREKFAYDTAQTIREEIENCQSIEELQEIRWPY